MKQTRLLTDGNPSISGIISGTCKGKVWYDKKTNPSLAVTYSYCVGGCGVAGEIPKGKEEQLLIECKVAGNYSIEKVTEEFLERCKAGKIENSKLLTERLFHSWESEECFLKESVCYVAMEKNELVGIIFGSARFKQYITIDIEVEKTHRRHGLAAAITKEFVNDCVRNHLVAQWDHVESNEDSRVLAAKCGFRLFKSRPYYWFDI